STCSSRRPTASATTASTGAWGGGSWGCSSSPPAPAPSWAPGGIRTASSSATTEPRPRAPETEKLRLDRLRILPVRDEPLLERRQLQASRKNTGHLGDEPCIASDRVGFAIGRFRRGLLFSGIQGMVRSRKRR